MNLCEDFIGCTSGRLCWSLTLPPRSHSLKTQLVVSGLAAKGTSDAEELIVSHTSQQGVDASRHMKQPEDTGEEQVTGVTAVWQFVDVGDNRS